MQMGRWFGFREGYAELTRIWTTDEIADQFAHLALVEHQLREDIKVYDDMQLTPRQVGMRIWQHPSMQVTSPLKRRFATTTEISQSYSGTLAQTFKYPFDQLENLATLQDSNSTTLQNLINSLGNAAQWDDGGPTWRNVSAEVVVRFLSEFRQDSTPERAGCSMPLICSYIEHQHGLGELFRWTISVRGRETLEKGLGDTTWTVAGRSIHNISRTRIKNTFSVGVVTSPGDEIIGLDDAGQKIFRKLKEQYPTSGDNVLARRSRSPEEGLLLIYPISKKSAPVGTHEARVKLFDEETAQFQRDLIALAISFPFSLQPQPVQAYLTGTVGWRSYDESS